MRQLVLGILIGSALTAAVGYGGEFYNSKGEVIAPRGSTQAFDYYRQRQAWIDLGHVRAATEKSQPCAK